MRRTVQLVSLLMLLALLAACSNKKVKNPIADVDSKQPDKVLFDRAMEALKRNKFDVARMTLQTLLNTYQDSEYQARAKLGVADSWYAEGGSAALAQAESEYKDFITFFPNMPEAAEAQLKIANIHYQQMEKPDRDYTHAKRAEDEYRQLLLQFPDSKLADDAKTRLREVQEVLAEREFRIGRFYFLRQSWIAAIARLKSLADTYPLYSEADEALFMLGNAYERQIDNVRASGLKEVDKGRLIQMMTNQAAEAYSRIVSRYPVMERAEDAKSRLQALRRPVPAVSEEALAQNKAEQASRAEKGMLGRMMVNFRKRPDVAQAAKVGEPTLVEPKATSAPEVLRQVEKVAKGTPAGGTGAVTVEAVKEGTPPPSQPIPRSESQPAPADPNAIPELVPNTQPASGSTTQTAEPERSPAVGQPATSTTAPAPPSQVNDAKTETESASPATTTSSSSKNDKDKDKEVSSSKKNKKKGVRKLFPF